MQGSFHRDDVSLCFKVTSFLSRFMVFELVDYGCILQRLYGIRDFVCRLHFFPPTFCYQGNCLD